MYMHMHIFVPKVRVQKLAMCRHSGGHIYCLYMRVHIYSYPYVFAWVQVYSFICYIYPSIYIQCIVYIYVWGHTWRRCVN